MWLRCLMFLRLISASFLKRHPLGKPDVLEARSTEMPVFPASLTRKPRDPTPAQQLCPGKGEGGEQTGPSTAVCASVNTSERVN